MNNSYRYAQIGKYYIYHGLTLTLVKLLNDKALFIILNNEHYAVLDYPTFYKDNSFISATKFTDFKHILFDAVNYLYED